MYLVIARCGRDDVPLRLFPVRDQHQAREYAMSVTEDDVIRAGMDVMGVGLSHVIAVGIVPFGDDGVPSDVVEIVQDFEPDPSDE